MSVRQCGLHEAHFSGLSGQSNVYGTSNVTLPDGTTKVLVSPLKEKVLCLEYLREKGNLKPISRDVQFAYIPDDAEIVSMDAFSKHGEAGGFIVGITVAKDTGTTKPCHYFNVYCPWEKDAVYNLESIAHGWSTMELDFIPFYLTHTQNIHDEHMETVFLLCGSDKRVHLYKEEKEIAITRFMEHPAEIEFPEFNTLPSIPLWIDIKYIGNHERITAVGCQNGSLRIAVVSLKSHEVTQKWELRHDGPITCLKLFKSETDLRVPPFSKLQQFYGDHGDKEMTPCQDTYHLLVTSALEVAVVYRNASMAGFENQEVLPESDLYDCALCGCIADVDWDGQNEILIGTYGQEVLAYKYHSDTTKQTTVSSSPVNANDKSSPDLSTDDKPTTDTHGEYRLHWKRGFSQPIVAMQYVDITGDGLCELVVVTTRGVHILQHCLTDAVTRCLESLTTMTTPKVVEEDEQTNTSQKDSTRKTDPIAVDQNVSDEGTRETVTEDVGKSTMTSSSPAAGDDVASKPEASKDTQKKTVLTLKEIAEAANASVDAES
ncbi:KICSTOR complex protein kaptin-like [Amphiura filiformis]|uniref:KICSTOR complex protein kaptin-like n=1 Tax=Amphiura filiformis TaxID=82378 RepID=UPI003B222E6A